MDKQLERTGIFPPTIEAAKKRKRKKKQNKEEPKPTTNAEDDIVSQLKTMGIAKHEKHIRYRDRGKPSLLRWFLCQHVDNQTCTLSVVAHFFNQWWNPLISQLEMENTSSQYKHRFQHMKRGWKKEHSGNGER
jgi:hypothetical protein